MKSKRVTGYFCGWENMNCWEVRNPETGKPTYYAAKRMYKYNTPYTLFIKKGTVVKTKAHYISRLDWKRALAWGRKHFSI